MNAPPVEAEIIGGSKDAIYVVDDAGRKFPLRRTDIRDIDHPGDVHEVVGAAILVYGIVNIFAGYSQCQDRTDYQAAFCIGVFTPATVGALMMAWGLGTHSASVDAADDHSKRDAFPAPQPLARSSPIRAARAPAAAVPAAHVELFETPAAPASSAPEQPVLTPPTGPSAPPAAPATTSSSAAPPPAQLPSAPAAPPNPTTPTPPSPPSPPKAAFPDAR